MMAVSAAGNQVARGPRGRSGFTLVEVLVVLAILVILFAMLFAPMIASLDMVTVGQAKVTMQTSARNVLGEMRREISNAMYIYPVPGAQYLGADDIAGTNYASDPEVFYPNYSQVAFVSPETEGGSIVEPLAPRMRDGQILVTVLSVELLDPNEDYSRSNPFVLVRKEGTGYQQFWNDTGTISWWDFDPAETLVRNVLSPRGSFDIPVSRSICTECGDVTAGYIAECAGGCDGEIIYVHSNVRFNPERVVGETLEASANRTLFHARHKAWAGLHNRGHLEINDVLPDDPNSDPLMQLGASALDPRITLVNPADRTDVVRDTWQDVENDPLDPRGTEIVATWNSDRGIVQIGSANGRWVNVPDPDLSITAGDSHPLQVQPEWPDPAITPTDPDEYNDQGIRTSSPRNWDLIPVYPSFSTPQPGDPVMPIAYRIDPTRAGNLSAAKIVPGSVRVVVRATDAADRVYQTTYSETSNIKQAEIGPQQFAVVYSDFDQRAEVRFNELRPPSPRMLTDAGITPETFGIYIQYYCRRNYDETSPEDDFVVRADYSTQEVMNLRLALQRYIEPEDDTTTGAKVIPDDAPVDRVSLEDQVKVRNLSN